MKFHLSIESIFKHIFKIRLLNKVQARKREKESIENANHGSSSQNTLKKQTQRGRIKGDPNHLAESSRKQRKRKKEHHPLLTLSLPGVTYNVLLCLMPDNFTHQRETPWE